MKRNKHKHSRVGKFISLFILTGIAILIMVRLSHNYLLNSRFFAVKSVIRTGALKSLLRDNEFDLKEKNIFSVDIQRLQRRIKLSYPYLAKVRVSRLIPDKIWLEAQERFSIARVRLANRIFLCDDEGAILPFDKSYENLVLIMGVNAAIDKVRIGEVYDSDSLKTALNLLRLISQRRELQGLVLMVVDVSNPESMFLVLDNGIKAIIGNEEVERRLRLLGLVLNNAKGELVNIKYIDLRFEEPAIGRK